MVFVRCCCACYAYARKEAAVQNDIDHKLTAKINAETIHLKQTLDRLVELRVEQELRQMGKPDADSNWLKPELLKIRTVTDAVINALEHHQYDGLRLKEFKKYVTTLNLPFHKPTISATLGRLKRNNKVVRESGGLWKLVTYANRPEEEKKT